MKPLVVGLDAGVESNDLQTTFRLQVKQNETAAWDFYLHCCDVSVCRGPLWGRRWRVCVLPVPPQCHLCRLCSWLQLCVWDWFHRSANTFYSLSTTVCILSNAPLVSGSWGAALPQISTRCNEAICTTATIANPFINVRFWPTQHLEAPLNSNGNTGNLINF